MTKHSFYPIENEELIKDLGLISYEIFNSDKTIIVNRCYVTQDPEDENLQVKRSWNKTINYGNKSELENHFSSEEIEIICCLLWNEEFASNFKAKQKTLAEAEKAKTEATKQAEETHEESLKFDNPDYSKSKNPEIYEKNSSKDNFVKVVDNTEYQEFTQTEDE